MVYAVGEPRERRQCTRRRSSVCRERSSAFIFNSGPDQVFSPPRAWARRALTLKGGDGVLSTVLRVPVLKLEGRGTLIEGCHARGARYARGRWNLGVSVPG